MPEGDAYRDELSAAQARISRLERELAEHRSSNQQVAMLVALRRERVRAAAGTQVPKVWPKLVLILVFLLFWATGAACLADGDLPYGVAAFAAPLLVGAIGLKILKANAAANRQQVALVDERIAEIEKALATGGAG
jgi:chromate transport protein ChrA